MVQEGRLVFASSSSPDDRLGELLLRRGRITLRQFADAGRAVGPGKRLGTVLVEQGVLTPKDLVKTVVDHTQEIIYGAFQWTEGQYRLQEGLRRRRGDHAQDQHARPHPGGHPAHRRLEPHRTARWATSTARYERAPDYEDVIGNMTLSFEKLSLLTSLNEHARRRDHLPRVGALRLRDLPHAVGVPRDRRGAPAGRPAAPGRRRCSTRGSTWCFRGNRRR